MKIHSVISPLCYKFCFYEFNSVTAMELGLWLMERPQLFHFSSRALEKVSQVILLMTYKKSKNSFDCSACSRRRGGGWQGRITVFVMLWKNNRKSHPKMLTKQKEKQGWKMLFSQIQLACYTFWSAMTMKSKELKYAFKKCLKAFFQAFFVIPKQS